MADLSEPQRLLAEAELELASLATRRAQLLSQIAQLRQHLAPPTIDKQDTLLQGAATHVVTNQSSQEAKIALFRDLFRGRTDIFPKRFESTKTGKTGYAPVCRNEWVSGICEKPRIRCEDCVHRAFVPVTDEVIRNHLIGSDSQNSLGRDFVAGVYPMLLDETCWFLVADFDKAAWQADAQAFLETCTSFAIPAVLERSRSGNGGHIWLFFSEAIPATLARKMGAFLLTQTMERRPELGLDSYDRLFPSQDTLPKGGFGNLIALPLQKKPRALGNSVFVDDQLVPFPDQWAHLSSIRRMSRAEVEAVVRRAETLGEVTGIRMPITDEADDQPWATPPSRRLKELSIVGPFPATIEIVLGNQIYIPKTDLTPSLRNRLMRLAAFQNPEFYQAQGMRLSTFGKPCEITAKFPKRLQRKSPVI